LKIHGTGKQERKFEWIPEKSLPLRKRKLGAIKEKKEEIAQSDSTPENDLKDEAERETEKLLLQGIKAIVQKGR
jgi:hypothetical protein